MNVTFDERNGILLVVPEVRRLDAEVAPEFRAEVGERAAGRSVVVLSLESVSFMDSSGLAGLISVLKRLAPGGQLRIAGANQAVRSLLKLTRLDTVLPVFDDTAAALA